MGCLRSIACRLVPCDLSAQFLSSGLSSFSCHLPLVGLNLVLRVLSHLPFHLAWWMFLTHSAFRLRHSYFFLASAHCHGDIHAIDMNRATFTASAAMLELHPQYLLKIRSMVEGEAHYALIIIRSLHSFTSDPVELALCPVVVLRSFDAYVRCKAPDFPISSSRFEKAATLFPRPLFQLG